MSDLDKTIAVAYLARGADTDWQLCFKRFIESYRQNKSGIKHTLYVIFKGFEHSSDLEEAKTLFSNVQHKPVYLNDDSLDIGAYIEWASLIKEDFICVFNTASEILAHDWLLKFTNNLLSPNIGLVGATASYESLNCLNSEFPPFPNLHLRSTAFMVDRKFFLDATKELVITSKIDAFLFESGPKSLTRKTLTSGKKILLVGSNGRGYSPQFWAASDTFRQGTQSNLLIADNQTRNFSELLWNEKKKFVIKTWGKFIDIRNGYFKLE